MNALQPVNDVMDVVPLGPLGYELPAGTLSDRDTSERMQLRTSELPRVWGQNRQVAAAIVDLTLAHMAEINTVTADMRLLDGTGAWIFDPRYRALIAERTTLQTRLGVLLGRLEVADVPPTPLPQHAPAPSVADRAQVFVYQ